MGSCLGLCMGSLPGSNKEIEALPIETAFKMPSPMPSWPSGGGGFAKGSVDLGGLEVRQVSTFTKVWASDEGGEGDLGATFFAPSSVPDGFFVLGSYAQPNNRPLFGWVLVAKDTGSSDGEHLAKPIDYLLVWSSESSSMKKEGDGYFWLPVAPGGYKSAGHIVTNTPDKPSLDASRCVRDDFTEDCEDDSQILSADGVDIRGLRPSVRGTRALGVWVGTFAAQSSSSSGGSPPPALACLKNKSSNFSSMPNPGQIQAIFQAYSPRIYFHPDERYLPSSVRWFFDNGCLLYQKGNATATTRVDSAGSNLPQGGSNDGEYWLDLPADGSERDRVRRGDLTSAEANIHVKPTLGGTFTDVAVWMFYPFNGPGRAKVGIINVKLGKIGEHVGDWEHVTLRVSNLTGELWRVYFSQHSGGSWVDASLLEYASGNRAVAYASLNGHAFYPKAGLVLQGNPKLGIGIRNDTARGGEMDTGARFRIVSAEYLRSPDAAVPEPPWLNYMREWGPKISYDIAKELAGAGRFLPKRLRRALEDLVKGLPDELLGEEGPTGPKVKASWNMDEALNT